LERIALKQSVRAYYYNLKEKRKMETADVSLDQNPWGFTGEKLLVLNHTKTVGLFRKNKKRISTELFIIFFAISVKIIKIIF
jgi:hypothetical protein